MGFCSSVLLIKPSAVQLNIAFHFNETGVPDLFFMFKAHEHVSNQTVDMAIFII